MAAEQLSDLQLAFMNTLWALEEATGAEVQERLAAEGRPLAPTTVSTVLRRLEAQGWVTHRERGRQFIYRPAVSRREATGNMLDRITRSLFGGDLPAVVSQLLDGRRVGKRDLEAIRALIEQKEQAEQTEQKDKGRRQT
jgi:BlaI family transcriptional regulator, penicillinase repressor